MEWIFHRSNNSAVGHIALRLLQGAMQKVRRIEKPLKETFKEIYQEGIKNVSGPAPGTGAGPNY